MRRRHLAEPGIEWRGEVAGTEIRDTFCQATVVVAPYQVTAGSSATVHQAIDEAEGRIWFLYEATRRAEAGA